MSVNGDELDWTVRRRAPRVFASLLVVAEAPNNEVFAFVILQFSAMSWSPSLPEYQDWEVKNFTPGR